MTDQSTQPLAEGELAQIRSNHDRATEDGLKSTTELLRYARSASDVPRLLDEVDRLRAENTAQARQLDAVREIKPQRRNSVFVSSEQLAVMRGWNDAVDAIRAAVNPCECGMTDPSTWTTYGGLTEPGSAYEWNPDCPAHGDPDAPALGLDQNEEGQANA